MAAQEGAQDYLVKGRIDSDQLLTSMRYAIEAQTRQRERMHSAAVSLIASSLERKMRWSNPAN